MFSMVGPTEKLTCRGIMKCVPTYTDGYKQLSITKMYHCGNKLAVSGETKQCIRSAAASGVKST